LINGTQVMTVTALASENKVLAHPARNRGQRGLSRCPGESSCHQRGSKVQHGYQEDSALDRIRWIAPPSREGRRLPQI